jgi:hypothetical protein
MTLILAGNLKTSYTTLAKKVKKGAEDWSWFNY